MSVATAPTVEIGYAQQHVSNWWLYDPNETTPELQWPMSVYVYDQMRRQDAQVTSVLRAVTLPVRRTPWRIDPNGARDEVVQLVADDLGLPIVGSNPEPPPRSKDRFSWPEHLRQALLMLPFGHMFFEILFRVTDDGTRAHLRKLAPRMPRTIERIDVADDGGLISISQYWMKTTQKPRPIPVDRLVAYVHELEGGNWLGTSILRPAYKNWLLKDRLLRVQAQTIERNGMGIPLYKAQENATPTDMASGLAMATAWRAGDAAGSATPFGADLVLRGVEGTLPDAEPAIRYHDEQIARAVLAHFLNLGTQTGSWALGTTFADFFTLSLQTLAQQIADTATCHIVEDMVDINFGPDEPAPRVTFDEIGSRQAATAAAIKTLVDAGVIRPDQVLEESSRQQYGLPPADPDTVRQPPAAAGPDPNAGAAQQLFGNSVAATGDPGPKGDAASAAPVEAKFHPDEPRIPGGEHGGEWSHGPGGAIKDALKLAGRIDLAPGEALVESTAVDLHDGVAKIATTDMHGQRGIRLGLGNGDFVTDPWKAANKGLTVKLDSQRTRDVADGLDAAAERAKTEAAAADKLWAAAEAAKGSPEYPQLLKRADDAVAGFVQTSATIPGEWGDVHVGYRVHDVGFDVVAAVKPASAAPDWDLENAVDNTDGALMTTADAAKLARTLRASVQVQASSGQVAAADWNPQQHLRSKDGKFRTMVDRIAGALTKWHAEGGHGDPLGAEFNREQLRRAAVTVGLNPKRGASENELKKLFYDHTRTRLGGKPDAAGKTTPKSPEHGLAEFRAMSAADARDALDLKKVDELKPMLREAGLPVSGRKRDLVDRLVEHIHAGGGKPTPPAPKKPAPRKPATPLGAGTKRSQDYFARVAAIEKQDLARPKTVRNLANGGGMSAETQFLTMQDGTKLVRKTYHQQDADRYIDSEVLGALVADATGVHAPAITRDGNTIHMEHLDGEAAAELRLTVKQYQTLSPAGVREAMDLKMKAYQESEDGRRLGIADFLMGNFDRNTGNWIVMPDGRIAAIDHGGAFTDSHGNSANLKSMSLNESLTAPDEMFTRDFISERTPKGPLKFKDRIDLGPINTGEIRRNLTAYRAEFKKAGHLDWFDLVMRNLDELEKRAAK